MVRKYFLVVLAVLCLCCCSSDGSEPEPPNYVVVDTKLCPFVSELNNSRPVDTVYVGTSYRLKLSPYHSYYESGFENLGEISNVVYLLDGKPVANAPAYPFFATYVPDTVRGKCTLSVSFDATVIFTSTLSSQIYVLARVP